MFQILNRENGTNVDTLHFPGGEPHTVLTDPGYFAVTRSEDGTIGLTEQATPEQEAASPLQPVWENGKFVRTQSFNDIRNTLWGS